MPKVKTPPAASAASGKKEKRYNLSHTFFEEAINGAIHDSLFSPVSLGERHTVKVKPNFNTACWAWLPPHNIYVGAALFDKDSVKDGLTSTEQKKYIANHYHHELGHALYTIRDMKRLKELLKAIDAPFPLYNLFEDAYMEERYRVQAEYQFEWLKLENLDFNDRPESILFALIQSEGIASVVASGISTWKPKPPSADNPLAMLSPPLPEKEIKEKLNDLFPKVVGYYKRIIAVTESLQLLPILKEWLDEFGKPPESPSKGSGKGGESGEGQEEEGVSEGMTDLEMSAELMTNPDALADFDKDAKVVLSEKEGGIEGGKKLKATPKEDYAAIASKGTVLHSQTTEVDVSRASKIAAKLLKFFAQKTRMVSTSTPQRRMSARHFALDRAPYRRAELEGRGRKKIFLEIDCSGSMGGFHIMEGKTLLTALSILAKKGYVEGHVALSAVKGSPCYETFKLPMSQEMIDRIQGYAGAEGLEFTMKENQKLLQEADYVFVYTDAQICDKPIEKEYFHKYNIFTWGLYAGERGDFFEEMIKYFDKAIMRKNAEELVDAMLAQNK